MRRRGTWVFWCDVRIGIIIALLLFMAGYLSAAHADEPSSKVIVTLCKLANPDDCKPVLATSSDFQAITMFTCADQASLAKWLMREHPTEFVKQISCQWGRREGRGI